MSDDMFDFEDADMDVSSSGGWLHPLFRINLVVPCSEARLLSLRLK
jgi:hypothetical protein